MLLQNKNAFRTFINMYSSASAGSKTFFLTSPIFYVNASPHIGHLYTALICDAASKFERLLSGKNNIFSTGTDEHGLKIQQSAQKAKLPIANYCDNISKEYDSMFKDFGVHYSDFIRTTDEKHKLAVEKFWTRLSDRGHIFSTNYSGWYCVPDETFLTESQLIQVPGKDIKVSVESGHPVEWTEEKNYMFKLSNFYDDLNYWLKNENVIRPKKYHKMVYDWINGSELLRDISVSRPTNRVYWGIPVPGDPTQTIYVWLDALVNYLTASGYPDTDGQQFRSCWPPDLHVIGKDILKFHAIYWPAFLIAAGLEPPKSILCHAHWTVDGDKMSKSKNNVISPNSCIDQYGAEGIRYFLLREGVAHSDGNYSDTKIKNILNSELADSFGNLLSRCCGKVLNPDQQFPTLHRDVFENIVKNNELAEKLTKSVENLPDIAKEHYLDHNYYKVVDATISTIHLANAFFEHQKPWELKKLNNQDQLDVVLHLVLETLRVCGIILWPIIPVLSQKLLSKLNIRMDTISWDNIRPLSWDKKDSPAYKLSEDSCVIYQRIQSKKNKHK